MLQRKPNILLVVLDTLRRDRLSLYGHTRETSPELDRFAADATVFERAVAPAQWTVPAHGSLFTGLYPGGHGLTQANGQLSGLYPTLAEILRAGGYHTVAFCNNPLVGVLDNGLQRGFDRFFNYASAVPQRPGDARRGWLSREFRRRFRPFVQRVGNQFAHHDTLFRIMLHPLLTRWWTGFINFKGHTANSVTDLIDYWTAYRAGGQDAPLFAFLNLMGAHLPYHPPQEALDRVAPHLRRERHAWRFVSRFNADAAAWASPDDPPLEDWQRRALHDFYDAEIAEQDAQLGRLLRWLESSGALDDTVVFILADHGEGHGEHGMFGHGFVVNQELVHVPLIARGPDWFPGGVHVVDAVSTRRVFHTALHLAGLRPPIDAADPNAAVETLSLVHVAGGAADAEGGLAFSEAVPPLTFLNVLEHRNPASIERLGLRLTRRAVYRGAHKLTLVGDRVEALYDVESDPAESSDLAAALPEVRDSLLQQVRAFAASFAGRQDVVSAGARISPAVEDHLRALGYID